MSSNVTFPVSKIRLQAFRAEYVEAYKQKTITDFINQIKEGIISKAGNPSMQLNTLNMTETPTVCYFDLRSLKMTVAMFDSVNVPTIGQIDDYLTPILEGVRALFNDTSFTTDDTRTYVKADWSPAPASE